jgi:hypothetical protein
MRKGIRTLTTFIGVWFVASLLNGILSGTCISISDSERFGAAGIIFLSCVLSFVCSIPLVGLVWLITAIAQSAGKSGYALFQVVLAAALFCGSIGALIFIVAFDNEFMEARFVAGACIIVSAMSGVLVFRKQLRSAA